MIYSLTSLDSQAIGIEFFCFSSLKPPLWFLLFLQPFFSPGFFILKCFKLLEKLKEQYKEYPWVFNYSTNRSPTTTISRYLFSICILLNHLEVHKSWLFLLNTSNRTTLQWSHLRNLSLILLYRLIPIQIPMSPIVSKMSLLSLFFFIQYPIKVQEMYLVVMPLLFLLVQNSPAHFFKWQCLFDSILTRFINASCSESLTSSPLGWEFNFGLFFFFSSLFTLCSGQSHPGLWL